MCFITKNVIFLHTFYIHPVYPKASIFPILFLPFLMQRDLLRASTSRVVLIKSGKGTRTRRLGWAGWVHSSTVSCSHAPLPSTSSPISPTSASPTAPTSPPPPHFTSPISSAIPTTPTNPSAPSSPSSSPTPPTSPTYPPPPPTISSLPPPPPTSTTYPPPPPPPPTTTSPSSICSMDNCPPNVQPVASFHFLRFPTILKFAQFVNDAPLFVMFNFFSLSRRRFINKNFQFLSCSLRVKKLICYGEPANKRILYGQVVPSALTLSKCDNFDPQKRA